VQPKFIDRNAFTVMGLQESFTPETEDFEGIWKRFMRYHDQIRPHSTDGAYYGVCFGSDDERMMEYVAGMAVPAGTECPEVLVIREVPPAHYAVFECTVASIHETYEHIHGTWIAESEYMYDRPKPDFEQYPPGTDSSDSPVLIHMSVRRKKQ
jgi:predicted transcriptional regulator YdeE